LYGKDTFEDVTSVSVQTENAARIFAAMRAASTFPSLREVFIDAETVPELRAHTLHHIASFNSIETVSAPFVRLQGSELAVLRTMDNLRSLDLSGTHVGDDALFALTRCASLQSLILHGTDVSDVGVAQLSALRHLQNIDLSKTRVTDSGVESIATLPDLRRLDLSHTSITDEAFARLARTRTLRVLRANSTCA